MDGLELPLLKTTLLYLNYSTLSYKERERDRQE